MLLFSERGLSSLEDMCCLEAVLESMRAHPNNPQIHIICLIAVENMCRAGIGRLIIIIF